MILGTAPVRGQQRVGALGEGVLSYWAAPRLQRCARVQRPAVWLIVSGFEAKHVQRPVSEPVVSPLEAAHWTAHSLRRCVRAQRPALGLIVGAPGPIGSPFEAAQRGVAFSHRPRPPRGIFAFWGQLRALLPLAGPRPSLPWSMFRKPTHFHGVLTSPTC